MTGFLPVIVKFDNILNSLCLDLASVNYCTLVIRGGAQIMNLSHKDEVYSRVFGYGKNSFHWGLCSPQIRILQMDSISLSKHIEKKSTFQEKATRYFTMNYVAELSTRNSVFSAKTYDSPITVGRLNALSKYPREVTRSIGNCDNLGIRRYIFRLMQRLLSCKIRNDCLKSCKYP